MALNSIVYFSSLAISFFLFFFNVPYWTGRDMADMSKSGIWRAFFRFLSFLGYGLHKVYMHVAGWILDLPLRFLARRGIGEKNRIWYGLVGFVDALCSAGTLFLLIGAYNSFMNGLFPAGVDTLAGGNDGSLLGKLSEAVVFLRVVSDLKGMGEGVGGVVAAVVVTLVAVVLYVVINTLFFSTLFGFLRELLEERPFWELAKEKLNIAPAPAVEREEEMSAAQRLLKQLKEAVEGFFNKTTVHRFMYDPVSLLLFLLALLVYSVVMTRLGKNNVGLMDVVKQVLDSIGVVQIIASFLVTYLVGKLTEKTAKSVVKVLPQGVQNAIHSVSAKGNVWADAEDAKRHLWAQEHQARKPQSETPPVSVPQQQEDPGAQELLSAASLAQTVFEKTGYGTVSEEEIFALLDSGTVSKLEGWKDLKTDAEKGVFIRKKVVDITVAIINKREKQD